MRMLKFLCIGLVCALITNLWQFGLIFEHEWSWARTFPLPLLNMMMNAMATFFHEIGHTVFAWFFGYATLPMFDFKHGGGFALSIGGQQIIILIGIWIGLVAVAWKLREHKIVIALVVITLCLNLACAFNDGHMNVIDFMGPAFECWIGGFFLFRAVFDLAPRGALERFLNAYFGCGFLMSVFVQCYGLLHKVVSMSKCNTFSNLDDSV